MGNEILSLFTDCTNTRHSSGLLSGKHTQPVSSCCYQLCQAGMAAMQKHFNNRLAVSLHQTADGTYASRQPPVCCQSAKRKSNIALSSKQSDSISNLTPMLALCEGVTVGLLVTNETSNTVHANDLN